MTVEVAESRVQPLAGTFHRMLRGVHHLVLNTDDMKKTVDFYSGVLGMPLVGAIRVEEGVGTGPENRGNPPFEEIRHYFFDMGRDALLAFFEMPKGAKEKGDRNALGAMQHVSFACGPKRHREVLERLKANGTEITGGPLVSIPPAIVSFYFFDPNNIRLEIVCDPRNADEENLDVIGSCRMNEAELRAELAGISDDKAWIDAMIAAMSC